MVFLPILQQLLLLSSFIPAFAAKRALKAPTLPFSNGDRWILDANDATVPYIGINWPGAAEAIIPEGLQYQSIANIVGKVVETGFNSVRLTFPIELVDDILDNGGDVMLNETLINALGVENGTIILADILRNNPQFTEATTRLQVRNLTTS